MNFPLVSLGPRALPFYALQAAIFKKRPYGGFVSDCPQGGWPAAIFYSLGYPKPYTHYLKMNFNLSHLKKKVLVSGISKKNEIPSFEV
jgi:hypothetical protein